MLEKSGTIKHTKSFHIVNVHELEQVSRIADACHLSTGIDYVTNNRVFWWLSKRRLWDPKSLAGYHHNLRFNLRVMTVENKVVGYLSYFFGRKTCVIDEIGVDPNHRRKRYATDMVTRMQVELNASRSDPFGMKQIGVKVGEKNLAAQLMFRKCGFRWIKTIPQTRPGFDLYAMQYNDHG